MCLTREQGNSALTRRGRCTTVRAVWRPTPGSTCTTSGSSTSVGTIYRTGQLILVPPPPLYPIWDLIVKNGFGLEKMSMNKIPGKFSVILRTLFFPLFSTQLINVRRFGAVNLDFFFFILAFESFISNK